MVQALLILVLVVLAYVLYVLIAGTLKTYRKQRVPIHLDLKDNSWADNWPEWRGAAKARSDELLALGFEQTGFITSAADSSPYVELLSNPNQPLSANVTCIVKGPIEHAYTQMKTTFDDGTIVCTIDSRQPSLFKYPPDIKLTRSRAESARQLMDEHLRAVAAQNVNRRPIASPQSETLDSVVESNARVTLFQVERGLLRRTDHPNALRYTFSGAVKSTFKVWARFQFLRPSRA